MHAAIIFLNVIALAIYHITSSFVSLFLPRSFRRKKDIEGQRVLITGAGNGLGRQLAIEFSKHSVCLILVDINKQGLLETEKLLDERSVVFIYECDVSDYKKVYEMAVKVKREAGDVDILVNNAGVVIGKHLQDLPEQGIVKMMEINVLAHFWTCKAFLPAMMAKNSGHLVSVLSGLAKAGYTRLTDYCSSKYAALGFAESLEVELSEKNLDGIKVTTVFPAHMNTDLFRGTAINYIGTLTPEHVAKQIVLGVLEEQEMVFVPHFMRYILLLKELFPRWMTIKVMKWTNNMEAMGNFNGRLPSSTDMSRKTK